MPPEAVWMMRNRIEASGPIILCHSPALLDKFFGDHFQRYGDEKRDDDRVVEITQNGYEMGKTLFLYCLPYRNEIEGQQGIAHGKSEKRFCRFRCAGVFQHQLIGLDLALQTLSCRFQPAKQFHASSGKMAREKQIEAKEEVTQPRLYLAVLSVYLCAVFAVFAVGKVAYLRVAHSEIAASLKRFPAFEVSTQQFGS